MVDYPGFGRSEGSPSEANCFAAADAGYEWLTQTMAVPAKRILLYGGSLGGAVAVDLASRREHRALILVDTFASIPEMAHYLFPYFPVTRLVRNRFDSLSKIGKCKMPIFQVHRVGDPVVPYFQGKRLYDAAVACASILQRCRVVNTTRDWQTTSTLVSVAFLKNPSRESLPICQ